MLSVLQKENPIGHLNFLFHKLSMVLKAETEKAKVQNSKTKNNNSVGGTQNYSDKKSYWWCLQTPV